MANAVARAITVARLDGIKIQIKSLLDITVGLNDTDEALLDRLLDDQVLGQVIVFAYKNNPNEQYGDINLSVNWETYQINIRNGKEKVVLDAGYDDQGFSKLIKQFAKPFNNLFTKERQYQKGWSFKYVKRIDDAAADAKYGTKGFGAITYPNGINVIAESVDIELDELTVNMRRAG